MSKENTATATPERYTTDSLTLALSDLVGEVETFLALLTEAVAHRSDLDEDARAHLRAAIDRLYFTGECDEWAELCGMVGTSTD